MKSVLALFFLANTVQACTCAERSSDLRQIIEDEYKTSVFIGIVEAEKVSYSKNDANLQVAVFGVKKSFKGGERRITVESDVSSTCSPYFEAGKKYLMYLNKVVSKRRFRTGFCDLTKNLQSSSAAVEILKGIEAK